jgi:Fic family protein
LCIHPFNDGNGRMSRLLTTLLLYQNGFYVGKYISLEAKIAKNKDLYYHALARSQTGWHNGTENVIPFIKYILGTILAAYKDFEDRAALVEVKLPVLEMVRRASNKACLQSSDSLMTIFVTQKKQLPEDSCFRFCPEHWYICNAL